MSLSPGIKLCGTHRINGTKLFGPVKMSIAAGGWSCILGSSGVGKSTILRLIAGLPTGGRFEGSITSSDGRPLANRISYMAQSDLLFPWLDVLGNVTLGAQLRGEAPDIEQAMSLIDQVGLQDHVAKKPATLSGGMRQRVALARTLMENRPVVLLDEPFSALDARNRADMQELSSKVLNGCTVLLVTHDPGEAARLGNQIFLMTDHALKPCSVPATPLIRDTGAPETLKCQAELLSALRSQVS